MMLNKQIYVDILLGKIACEVFQIPDEGKHIYL
jgi:hypothetical protein